MSYRLLLTIIFAALFPAVPASSEQPDNARFEVNDISFDESDFFASTLDNLRALGLIVDEKAALKEELISFAKGFLGTRYRSGGKTPKGFDCSGFTSYVFRQFGYSLGASSYAQGSQGDLVDEVLDARPGDLIFFSGRRAGSRVGHVGMVVNVDRESGIVNFIHSSNQKGVVIDQYPDGGYYSRRFISVRRVL